MSSDVALHPWSCRSQHSDMTKTPSNAEITVELPFKLDSISKAAAPSGAAGVWHSYVISQGANTIAGVRAGTHAEVTTLLHDMIERLNERREGKFRPRSKR
jgi:hypothetical protein